MIPKLEIRKVLIPISSPRASTNAPPEFPGLMAASVWMNSPGLCRSLGSGFGRFSALMIPRVTVKRNPYGLPKARTVCPGRRSAELPQGTLGKSLPLILMTARSVSGSAPTSFAG